MKTDQDAQAARILTSDWDGIDPCVERLEAGAALMHIRGEVLKALRAGADGQELHALMLAERNAHAALAALYPSVK